MKFLLTTLAASAGSILLMRWGLNHSTPDQDMRHMQRLIGRLERACTRLSAACTRLVVKARAVLGFDETAWEYLRRKWQSGGYAIDT